MTMHQDIDNTNTKVNLLELDAVSLKDYFHSLGEKSFRATQVFKWIHLRGIDNFNEMTDLSKSLREKLIDLCELKAPTIAVEQPAKDGTRKWLMRLEDGNHVETVFIPEQKRGTLCISSQVGCMLNCQFCSTAKQGFNRNLSVAEIIGQVWQAKRRLMEIDKEMELDKEFEKEDKPTYKQMNINELCNSITNVVLMGMGEPLLNFEPVVKALSIMRDENGYRLPKRRVTLSTSGVVPYIDRLKEESDVALAVSLHAPNDELRDVIVPINRKYPISELLEACKRYVKDEKRCKITFEYVMLRNVNDTLQHAKQLAKILRDVPCKINLIPFNSFGGTEFQRSDDKTIEAFRFSMINSGYVTTIRKTRGMDIDAACGQLKGKVMDKTRRQERWANKQKDFAKKESHYSSNISANNVSPNTSSNFSQNASPKREPKWIDIQVSV